MKQDRHTERERECVGEREGKGPLSSSCLPLLCVALVAIPSYALSLRYFLILLSYWVKKIGWRDNVSIPKKCGMDWDAIIIGFMMQNVIYCIRLIKEIWRTGVFLNLIKRLGVVVDSQLVNIWRKELLLHFSVEEKQSRKKKKKKNLNWKIDMILRLTKKEQCSFCI